MSIYINEFTRNEVVIVKQTDKNIWIKDSHYWDTAEDGKVTRISMRHFERAYREIQGTVRAA